MCDAFTTVILFLFHREIVEQPSDLPKKQKLAVNKLYNYKTVKYLKWQRDTTYNNLRLDAL